MRWYKSLFTVVLLLTIALLAGQVFAGQREAERMKRKLAASQKVLEGIAVGNFKQIEKSAEDLLLLSKEAGWKVLNTPGYEMHSNEFRRIAQALIKNAEEKNLDAAALNYVEITLTCVKCHKHVREIRMTRVD